MPDFSVLKPTATKNYIKNPSFELNTAGWVPAWTQEITFEEDKTTPLANKGFDALGGAGSANLNTNSQAAIRGNFGFEVPIIDTDARFGSISNSVFGTQTFFTYEFFVRHSLIIPVGNNFTSIQATSGGFSGAAFTMIFQNTAGVIGVRFSYSTDAAVVFFNQRDLVASQDYLIRIEWKASSAPGANDGFARYYINGGQVDAVNGIDNDGHIVASMENGAVSGVDAATSGNINFDNVRWAQGLLPFTGSSIETTKERARFGTASLKMQTDGNSQNEGVYARISTLSEEDSLATASAYVRGAGEIRIRMKDDVHGSFQSKVHALHDDFWQRIEVIGRAGASNDVQVYIETADDIQSVTFYIDGVQLELQEEVTTYCDGDQPGCRWEGAFHASQSTRSIDVASGGKWISLNNEEESIYITVIGGIGLPPVVQNFQPTPAVAGGFFDNTRVNERTIQLVIWTVNNLKDKEFCPPGEMSKIHALRQQIIDLVKPDFAPNSQPFILRYTENGRSFTIECRYEAGLNFDSDIRNIYTNTIPLRLLALDPFWEEDTQEVSLLDVEKVQDLNFLGIRQDGEWQIVGNDGLDSGASSFGQDPVTGRLYIGGSFTADGEGNQVRRIGRMSEDFSILEEIGGTGLNDTVRTITPHPNGKIIIGGSFTGDNAGNTFNRIVEYDPVTDTFAALGTGFDSHVQEVQIAPDGDIYAVGNFTTADGGIARRIARWDGGAWRAVGDGADNSIQAILIISETEIYISGAFENVNNPLTGAERFARWNGTLFASLGTQSFSGSSVNTLLLDPADGSIILMGAFTLIGGITTDNIIRWNGSNYVVLGDGVGAGSGDGDFTKDGLLINGGRMQDSLHGERTFGFWTGSNWVWPDINTTDPGNGAIGRPLVLENGDLIISFSFNGEYKSSAINLVPNIGSAEVGLILTVTADEGRVGWLENQTTGQRVYINYDMQLNEELTFTFTEKNLSVVSNYRGLVPDAILPNSDNIILAAGTPDNPRENIIALFLYNSINAVAQTRYIPLHWSVDAIG